MRKHKNDFDKVANHLTLKKHARPVQPTAPAAQKTAAEKLKEDVAILHGLARAYLNLKRPNFLKSEEGREVQLTGKASTGLAIIAIAALLETDASGEGHITLRNNVEGDFSKAAGTAIVEIIKGLHSAVEVVTSRPLVPAVEPPAETQPRKKLVVRAPPAGDSLLIESVNLGD